MFLGRVAIDAADGVTDNLSCQCVGTTPTVVSKVCEDAIRGLVVGIGEEFLRAGAKLLFVVIFLLL